MTRICDALELLTSQHEEILGLLDRVAKTPDPEQRSLALTDLADSLTVHLAVEQEMFYPAFPSVLSAEVKDNLLAEHAEIKRILADMLWQEHDEQLLERKLIALRALIGRHAAWQEHDLFVRCAEGHLTQQIRAVGTTISGWLDGHIAASAA